MSKTAKLMSTAPSSCFVRDTCPLRCLAKVRDKNRRPSSGNSSLFFVCDTKILLLAASSTTHSLAFGMGSAR